MKQRNQSIDFLKGIAAIFVVFIHVKFGGLFGDYIAAIGAFAVPIFFMVSGYFSYGANQIKTKHSILNTIKLIAIVYFINLIRIFIMESCSISKMWDYLASNVFTFKHMIMWLCINTTVISGVAWFLWALLYCYLLCYIFYNLFSTFKAYIIILIIGFLGGVVVQILFPIIGMNKMSINNVWFCGLPYFLLGKAFHEKQKNLMLIIKTFNLLLMGLIGWGLITIGFLGKNGIAYLGVLALVSALFINAIFTPNMYNKLICTMGSKYAFFIYIMHPIVMHIIECLQISSTVWVDWIKPFVVLVITVLLAMVFYIIKEAVAIYLEKVKCKNERKS